MIIAGICAAAFVGFVGIVKILNVAAERASSPSSVSMDQPRLRSEISAERVRMENRRLVAQSRARFFGRGESQERKPEFSSEPPKPKMAREYYRNPVSESERDRLRSEYRKMMSDLRNLMIEDEISQAEVNRKLKPYQAWAARLGVDLRKAADE